MNLILIPFLLLATPIDPPDPIPLVSGTTWVYEGAVSWTVGSPGVVKSDRIRWSMQVIETRFAADCRAAVVKNFVADVAWYEPNQAAQYTVIASRGSNVYKMSADTLAHARSLLADLLVRPDRYLTTDNWFLSLRLAKGHRWPADTARDDNLYCWSVEDTWEAPVRAGGTSASVVQAHFVVAYRTLSDDQSFEIVPGVGITRYVFGHHGTVSSADVHLVEIVSAAAASGR